MESALSKFSKSTFNFGDKYRCSKRTFIVLIRRKKAFTNIAFEGQY
jgi:hypothetical protein